MLRTEVQQALRAMTALARDGGQLSLADLARRTAAPAPTLARVLARLGRMGLVVGRRGRHGGYRLARPAGEIRLDQVVLPLQGADLSTRCLLGLPRCSRQTPCPLHDVWSGARGLFLAAVQGQTLLDLARGDGALTVGPRPKR